MNYRNQTKLRTWIENSQNPKNNQRSKYTALQILNQPISLFIIGTIAVGLLSAFISERRQCVSLSSAKIEQFGEVLDELKFRVWNIRQEMREIGLGVPENERVQLRLRRFLQLRSSDAPYLYRQFRGERLDGLIYRIAAMGQQLEVQINPYVRPQDDITVFNSMATRNPPSEFIRIPSILDVRSRNEAPGSWGDALQFVFAGANESQYLQLMTDRVAKENFNPFDRTLAWIDILSLSHLRTKNGCGPAVTFRRMIGIE